MSVPLPALFAAHGAPTLVAEQNEYTRFLQMLASRLPKPQAIVLVSAHWESPVQQIGYAEKPETIHDFFGFPDELYRIAYPAKGSRQLAEQISRLLDSEGIPNELNERRGLDHGAWGLLKIMYPQADVPVVPMSVNPRLIPEEQYRIGRAIGALRQDQVLVIGSGGTVHNLHRLEWSSQRPSEWAVAFDEWLGEQLETWNTDALFQYETLAPYAREATPTPEHFVPLLVAMGSADAGAHKSRLLHRQYQMGSLSLSGWMFG